MSSQDLGFSWNFAPSDWENAHVGKDVACFRLKKLMTEFVWDILHLEDNPYDFVEVQTLMEGITVGGHTLADQQQVLNQAESLKRLFKLVKNDNFSFNIDSILQAHNIIAKEEALQWGCLRKGSVRISGTDHAPPDAGDLEHLLTNGISTIKQITHPVEQALVYFCFGSLNQFFYDGNKRTSRWVMNGLLMSHGYNYLTVPGREKNRFNQVMVDFYDKKDASQVMKFMASCYVKD